MMEETRSETVDRAFAPLGFRSDSSIQISPPPHGDLTATQDVVAELIHRHRTSTEQAAARSAAITKVLLKWREAIEEQVRPETWRRLADFSRKQRMTSLGLETVKPRVVASDQIASARKEARERSLELLREEGVKQDAVQAVHAGAHEELLGHLRRPDSRAHKLEVTREEEVPAAVRQGKTNPWFLKTPPYDGYHWSYSWHTWGGQLSSLNHNIEIKYGLQYPTGSYISGQIGHYSHYKNYSASDFDGLWLNYVTQVGFWYNPQSSGQKQIWIKFRCPEARADIYLDDEWGWSDSSTSTFSRLRLDVVQVPGLEGQTGDWHLNVKGSPDSTWYHLDWIAPGSTIWIPFTANFPPGWVYVSIGADDQRQTILNDVSTSQTMDSRYVVEEVWIAD